jgi:hypothetical protein
MHLFLASKMNNDLFRSPPAMEDLKSSSLLGGFLEFLNNKQEFPEQLLVEAGYSFKDVLEHTRNKNI